MNYLEENLTWIKKNQAHLCKSIAVTAEDNIEFFTARSGAVSARLDKHYLHSRFDPVKEACSLVQGKTAADISAAVFFGFGLGYHIEAFIQAHTGIPVLVFEPDPAIFRKILEARSLAPVLSSKQVRILLGRQNDPVKEIQALPLVNLQIIKLRSVYEKDAAYYAKLEQGIRSFLTQKEINLNTLNRFGRLWVKNLVKNIRQLAVRPGITCLANHFKDIPALVLASGPSVDEIWPVLQQLHKKFLIIAVDTSLRACLDAGVEPDFIIVVDPQYWNTRHIDWTTPTGAFLVSESSTHPRIFTSLGLKGFFASSFFPLGAYFESITGEKGKIGAGGSVATSAWDLARLAGCNPIYMAGLDLGFPGKQTHFKGAFFESTFHTLSNRVTTIEGQTFAYLRQAVPYYTESNNEKKVLTDKRMYIYKSWFETQMRLFPAASTFNLSAGGVRIQGMPAAGKAELLAFPDQRQVIGLRNEQLKKFFRQDHADDTYRQLREALHGLLDDLADLEKLSQKGLQQTAEIRRKMSGGKTYTGALESLDRIDQAILGQSSRFIAGFLLQPVIHNIINAGNHLKSPVAVIENNEGIYRELRDSARYHHRLLRQAYNRL